MRISAEGANRSKKKTIENKEQTARNELENFRTRSKPLERDKRMSAEGANRPKETREFQQKEQTARKRLENFSRRSKPLERD